MESLNRLPLLTLALAVTLALLQGCAATHAESGVVAAVRAEDRDTSPARLPEPPRPSGRQTVKAEGYPDVPPFETVARTPHVEAFPCSQCHNDPLSVLVAKRPKNEPLSHWQVKMQHAPDTVMTCQTCHGDGNMDQLQLLSGKPASFDAPYTQCAQCHMGQAKDWAGGAHGKRLDGWSGARVVENCTGCHNPHAPAFESRWPAQLTRGVR